MTKMVKTVTVVVEAVMKVNLERMVELEKHVMEKKEMEQEMVIVEIFAKD